MTLPCERHRQIDLAGPVRANTRSNRRNSVFPPGTNSSGAHFFLHSDSADDLEDALAFHPLGFESRRLRAIRSHRLPSIGHIAASAHKSFERTWPIKRILSSTAEHVTPCCGRNLPPRRPACACPSERHLAFPKAAGGSGINPQRLYSA